MVWIILGIIVLLLILKWRSNSKPINFVKGVAKAQLKAYETAQIRHPNASKEDLITEAISSRLNVGKYYSETEIRWDLENESGGGTYRQSIKILIIREYEHLTGAPPSIEILDLIEEQVDLIIPEDL